MLESALKVHEGFEHLAKLDTKYQALPIKEERERGKGIYECLKTFYEIMTKLCGTKYLTANNVFYDVCNIQDK